MRSIGGDVGQKRFVSTLGSFDEALNIGQAVHVTSDRISELGAEDGETFLSLIDMDLIEDEDYNINHGEMKNTIAIDNPSINGLESADIKNLLPIAVEVLSIMSTKLNFFDCSSFLNILS